MENQKRVQIQLDERVFEKYPALKVNWGAVPTVLAENRFKWKISPEKVNEWAIELNAFYESWENKLRDELDEDTCEAFYEDLEEHIGVGIAYFITNIGYHAGLCIERPETA